MFLFLHIHTWGCMFLVKHLYCSGHSLSGPWGCESSVNSVVMKDSRTCPRGSQKNCRPPAQRPWSAPQLRGPCSQHHTESSLQTGETHSPSGLGFTAVFLLGDFYLLNTNVHLCCALFIVNFKLNKGKPQLDVLDHWITGCNVQLSIFLKTESKNSP